MTYRTPSLVRKTRHQEPETTVPMDITTRSAALVLIAAAALMAVLDWAREVFIPIALSILVSYALDPVVLLLMKLKLSRVIAAALVMTSVTASVGYIGYSLSDDAAAIVAEIPDAAAQLRRVLRRGREDGTLSQMKKAAEELQKTA